ncbi:pseudouridine synthase [Methylosinus sp. H3A]|uniref:pseudouridine synthase n=1 Tax=Methylosinus sp. H3A TaxID=2785786 RepID=UPI0018C2C9DE|nr:pseudouridine synthase [Methylosinus sp. H3A]MBG0808755.1 pseudouridine synthase [Methylosinus sp. H3A]
MTDKKPERPARRKDGGDQPPRRRVPVKPAPDDSAASAFEGERIAKVMARAGACSRRDAEIWVAEGRVSVNGRVLDSPAFNVQEGDRIEVDGQPLAEREPTRLFLFHKPAGLVTSAKDPEGRETVFGFLEERFPDLPRLVSVGRLDINTEGLLLLTNDGGLARTLELPATGWTRRYRVRAHGDIDQARLDELRKGVTVDDVDYAPIDAKLDRVQGANVWISMTLREGKNREIKRVLEHLGLDVNRLIRISFGPFQLGELAEGVVEEVRLKTLREQLGKGLAELAGVDFSSPRRETDEPPHVAAEEARQRAKTRSRKHVDTLRAEREETRGKGPRSRIERAATSDRKGRAVPVEKIVPVRRAAEEPAATRNARRFRAERTEGEAGFAGERRPPPRAESGEAPARRRFAGERAPRRDDDARPFAGDRERRPKRFDAGEGRPTERRARAPEGGVEQGRSERTSRPPRRDGEGRPPRRDGAAARAPSGERKERFDRGERRGASFGASEGPRRERAPRREGEGRPPRRDGADSRPRAGAGKERFDRGERREASFGAAPRREGEGRPPRREGADSRPRTGAGKERFDRGERREASFGDGSRRERAPRREGEGRPPRREGADSRPRTGAGKERFDRGERREASFGDGPRRERAPRREGEGRPPRREGADSRPRAGDGKKRFDRGGASFGAGDGPRRERAPRREGEGRPPRRDGADSRPPRKDGDARPPRRGAKTGEAPRRGPPRGGDKPRGAAGKGPRKPGGGAPRKPR